MKATQLDRYKEAQKLGSLKAEEVAWFKMLPDERPKQAADKLRSLLYVYKPTRDFRWSVRPAPGRELAVMKIGKF